jgi:beta-N-acetylhexosaminidase
MYDDANVHILQHDWRCFGESGMVLTINLAVKLAVSLFFKRNYRMTKKIFFCLLAALPVFSSAQAQAPRTREGWVDSVFNALSTGKRIGQLFLLPVSATMDESQLRDIEAKVKNDQIGGLLFAGTTAPVRQARIIRRMQDEADIPLLMAQEAPAGLGSTPDSLLTFPSPMMLGAIRPDSLLYLLGHEVGRQLKLLGVQLYFTSLGDTARNPTPLRMSPLSLGENPQRVAAKSVAFLQGLQSQQVLLCATHFPLKGITVTDVQKSHPFIQPSLDSAQVYPYKKLFSAGLTATMPASGAFPLIYSNSNQARKNEFNSAMLSSLYVGPWLKQKSGYRGMTFGDVRSTAAMGKELRGGEAELLALQAGNDMLVYPADVNDAIRRIRRAIRRDENLETQFNATIKKILAAKYDAGLYTKKLPPIDNLPATLHPSKTRMLAERLEQAAITVLRNQNGTLPIKVLDNKYFTYFATDTTKINNTFYDYLSRYAQTARYTIDENTGTEVFAQAAERPGIIIIGIFPQTPPETINRISGMLPRLLNSNEVILCDFGNESFLRTASRFPTVITTYKHSPELLRSVAEVIFGSLPADGQLPLAASTLLPAGLGSATPTLDRLGYAVPEAVGMDSRVLARIDEIANEAIRNQATPGCQVLVARHGKVVYDKTFGYQTYDRKTPVDEQTIYDLASLTKVSATLQAVMFMYEKGLIELHRKVSLYLPELRKSNKKDITIMELLTHQAGLQPFIPLWPQTVKDTTYLPQFYSRTRSAAFPLQVSPHLYTNKVMRDSIWSWVIQSKLTEKPPRTPYPYKYSDLSFMILQHLAEKVLNQPLEDFLAQNFYEPLGAYTTGFNPLDRFPVQYIAPTEYDKIYRREPVAGTVHDERAAMMGGVSGHAGLFSTANDLAKLGQMLLQEGKYGGYRYYKPETVRLFADRMYKGRRGLGWDKPVQSDWNSPTSLSASPRTYGHTGFTGTCLWVDPEFDVVYIFLSNRVYPDRSGRLLTANIRPRIQELIYQAIFQYCANSQ